MSKKLEQLRQKQAALQKQISAEQNRIRSQERKNDTRRKILLGAFLQAKLAENETYHMQIMGELKQYLQKDNDRALFGFDPLPKVPADENTQAAQQEKQTEHTEGHTQTLDYSQGEGLFDRMTRDITQGLDERLPLQPEEAPNKLEG